MSPLQNSISQGAGSFVRPRITVLARTQINAAINASSNVLKKMVRQLREIIGCTLYLCQDRRPLTIGYREYRDRYVRKAINSEKVLQIFGANKDLPAKFGVRLDERVVEYPWLLSRLRRYAEKSHFLDAGSTLNHETILEHPSVRAHKWSILTLAPEAKCFWSRGISYVYDDLRSLPFKEEWFDAAACISVIEHVGMDNAVFVNQNAYRENRPQDYLQAISEIRRVLKSGSSLFLTIPFGRYEHHGWLQQFDSGMLSTLINEFRPQRVSKTFFRYTEEGWKLASEEECRDLAFSDAIRNKHSDVRGQVRTSSDCAVAARGVACIELQK